MSTTTEELTPEQRLEVRRTLLQSIAEMGRGLKLAGLLLKQGKFASARDTITGTEAMLILHEGMATLLLKENQRLREQMAEALETMEGRAAAFEQTYERMVQDGLKPKAERSPDHDFDDTQRYGHYSSANRSSLMLLRRLLKADQ